MAKKQLGVAPSGAIDAATKGYVDGSATAVKTTGYTAAVGDIVRCNAIAGGFTVMLPLAPANGSKISVIKTDSSSNAVLVQRNGSDVLSAPSGPSLLQITVPGESVSFRYESGIWLVTRSPANLDHRYYMRPTGAFDSLQDRYGYPALQLVGIDNSANYIGISNAISGQAPSLLAQGSDADVSINLVPQGTGGTVSILSSGSANIATFWETSAPVNYWRIRPSNTGNAVTLTATGNDSVVHMDFITKNSGEVRANGAKLATVSDLTKTAVGLSNVDNTSDATKDAAIATLTNKTLTDPKINAIKDTNGLAAINITATASAVNHVTITNAATAGTPIIRAAGETNVGLYIMPKGGGVVNVLDSSFNNICQFGASTVTWGGAINQAFGTSTGTKLGTSTTQKIGFWNTTPAVQPTAVADATDATTVITQLNSLLAKLRTIGIIAT